jgi:hypothetical protein
VIDPQRCSSTGEHFTFFCFISAISAWTSSHIRKSSSESFSSDGCTATSDGGSAKISQPWPASTDSYSSTSRKKARSASGSLLWMMT